MVLCRYIMLVLMMLAGSKIATGQHIIVATYNLRYDNKADSGNLWQNRAPVVAGLIQFHSIDLLGTQEGYQHQLNDLCASMPQYGCYGVGRDDGKQAGEHSAIFYNRNKFALLDSGDFWLSATPDRPSLGWDATCCKRLCSWVKLRQQDNGKVLWCFNVHYDHQGIIAREESSKLLLRKVAEIAGSGIAIVMGDMNGGRNSSWYKRLATSDLLKDTYDKAMLKFEFNPSFHAFGKQLEGNEVIDHIFISQHDCKVQRWGILSDSYHGRFPSDHFPVLAELTY